jgi:hypothetical protein
VSRSAGLLVAHQLVVGLDDVRELVCQIVLKRKAHKQVNTKWPKLSLSEKIKNISLIICRH